MPSTADLVVEQIKRLIEGNSLDRAGRMAEQALTWFPKETRLWRLLGVTRGTQGRHEDARMAFLTAYELGGACMDVGNAISAMCALRESAMAIEVLKIGFAIFEERTKQVVAMSLKEAIRVGAIDFMDLPYEVQIYMKNVEGGVN